MCVHNAARQREPGAMPFTRAANAGDADGHHHSARPASSDMDAGEERTLCLVVKLPNGKATLQVEPTDDPEVGASAAVGVDSLHPVHTARRRVVSASVRQTHRRWPPNSCVNTTWCPRWCRC